MDRQRLERQFAFILEADKEKSVMRQTLLSNGMAHENDADHAWHMALMCLLLSEYANEKIDVLRTVGMILIHDIVEIDAGDTYAYDEQGQTTQRDRELKAADRLYNLLPPDQAAKLRGWWDEFEEGNRNKNTADGSAVLWDYAYEHFIRPHVEKGNILDNA